MMEASNYCDIIQGYLCSKPLAFGDALAFYKQQGLEPGGIQAPHSPHEWSWLFGKCRMPRGRLRRADDCASWPESQPFQQGV